MAKAWEYTQGTWTRIDDPMDACSGKTLSDLAIQLGFAAETRSLLGNEWAEFSFTTYRAKEPGTGPYDYLVSISVCIGDIEMVYLSDFPSYLMLAKELVPLVKAVCEIPKE